MQCHVFPNITSMYEEAEVFFRNTSHIINTCLTTRLIIKKILLEIILKKCILKDTHLSLDGVSYWIIQH